MLVKILGLILCIIGIVYTFMTIRGNYENATSIDIKNKVMLEKYNKIKKLLSLIQGLFYTIEGLLLVLNIISGKYAGVLVLAFFILNKIVEFNLDKEYKKNYND